MKARTLAILIAAGGMVTLASALLWTAPLDAWPSVCDNCMDGENQWGDPDAQCCLDGSCEMLEEDGYSYSLTNLEWCTTTVTENGVVCNGQPGCSAGGGGGGGGDGSCHIPYGELCPAGCMSCTYFYY